MTTRNDDVRVGATVSPYDAPMPFRPPWPETPIYLVDEDQWTTYGDLVSQFDDLLAPYDQATLDLFMVCMGAMTEAEVRRAECPGSRATA